MQINKLPALLAVFCFSFLAHSENEIPSKYDNLKKVKLSSLLVALDTYGSDEKIALLQDIEYLDCSWHQLDKTDFVHLLDQMPNIKVLDISHNEIKRIPRRDFKHMSKLKRLDISHNRLQAMEDMPFKNVLIELEELDVSHNEIVFGMVPNNEKMRSLDISYNILKALSIPSFTKEYSLQFLNVRHNRFQLRKGLSKVLTNLRYLDVSDNDLEDISFESIDFPMLRTLIIRENPISFMPDEISSKTQLRELDIYKTKITTLGNIESLEKLTYGGHVGFDLKSFVANSSKLKELRVIQENKKSLDWIYSHPNLQQLKSLSIESCYLTEFPDISSFPNLKRLSLYDNRITAMPPAQIFEGLKGLKSLDISVDVHHDSYSRFRNPVMSSVVLLEFLNALPMTAVQYYNVFVDRNMFIARRETFLQENLNENEKLKDYYTAYKSFLNSDQSMALIAIQAAYELEKQLNPCSEKQFLLELQCIKIIETLVTSESKMIEISSSDEESTSNDVANDVLESIVFGRYKDLYRSFDKCSFSNEKGMNKVKAELYQAYSDVVKILEEEYAAREARIQRLINGVGGAGTISAVGAGVAAGTFNNNLAAAGQLLSGVSDWAANTAEERARYLMKLNKSLSIEILEFKQLANNFLD